MSKAQMRVRIDKPGNHTFTTRVYLLIYLGSLQRCKHFIFFTHSGNQAIFNKECRPGNMQQFSLVCTGGRPTTVLRSEQGGVAHKFSYHGLAPKGLTGYLLKILSSASATCTSSTRNGRVI